MFSQSLPNGGYNFAPQASSTNPYLQYGQHQQQALALQYGAARPQHGHANALALRGPHQNYQGPRPSSIPTELFDFSSVRPTPAPHQPNTFSQNLYQQAHIQLPYHFHYLPSQTNNPLQQQNVSAPYAHVGHSHPGGPSPPLARPDLMSSQGAYAGQWAPTQIPGPFSAASDIRPLAGLSSLTISEPYTANGGLAPAHYPGPFSVDSDTEPLAIPSTLTSVEGTHPGESAPAQHPDPFSADSNTRPLAGPSRQIKTRRARDQPPIQLPVRCVLAHVGCAKVEASVDGAMPERCGAVFDTLEEMVAHIGRDGEHGIRNDKTGKEKCRCTWEMIYKGPRPDDEEERVECSRELTGSGGLLRHIKECHLGMKRDRKGRWVYPEWASFQLPNPVFKAEH